MSAAPARKTKIVATLGPACAGAEAIAALVDAGADVLRANTSHLTADQATALYQDVTQARTLTGKPFGLLVDLQGPKLRLGRFEPRRTVTEGQQVWLRENDSPGEPDDIPVAIELFASVVNAGDTLIMGDSVPVLQVDRTDPATGRVLCTVTRAGTLKARMGVALPGGGQDLPTLTESDLTHLAIAAPHADFVALSFPRTADDMIALNQLLDHHNSRALSVAKLERRDALEHQEAIIRASHVVMVARGDLGVEIGLAHVPFAQRDILACARDNLTCSITATQVLESMIHSEQPTRAEITDIANAIADGTSALMLSEETAMGDHPHRTVRTMAEIILQVEEHLQRDARDVPHTGDPRASVVNAADQLSADMDADVMIIPTDTGYTARSAAALAHRTIIALADDPVVRQQLAIERGVIPVAWDGDHGAYLPITAAGHAVRAGLIDPGQRVVVAWGQQVEGEWVQLIACIPALSPQPGLHDRVRQQLFTAPPRSDRRTRPATRRTEPGRSAACDPFA